MLPIFVPFLLQTVPVPPVNTGHLLTIAPLIVIGVYIVLQLTKQILPAISGTGAILLNFLLSAGAYVVALPMDQWFTTATFLALAVTVAGAAGVHGTVSKLTADKPPTP